MEKKAKPKFLKLFFDVVQRLSKDKRDLLFSALIFFLGFTLYQKSFSASFIFDDFPNIIDNPFIRHLNVADIWQFDPSRFLTNLTFCLNYLITGLSVFSWHLVNLLLHCGTSILAYRLTCITFQTPKFKDKISPGDRNMLAMFIALVFFAHPIQTEGVIYLVQRSTLLCSFFYLAAIYCYAKARIQNQTSLYAKAVIMAYLGMLSKPLIMTLPIMIAVYDIVFFGLDKKNDRKRTISFVLLSLPLLIVPLGLLGLENLNNLAIQGYHAASFKARLLTQIHVLITYIRLMFFPVNQNLDYDYPIVDSFNGATFISLLAVLSVFGLTARLIRRQKLLGFGIVWFFVTLGQVSSFPLADMIFEHWLYLSCYGFSLFFCTACYQAMKHLKTYRTVMLIVVITLSGLTYQRVFLWQDPVLLWQDTVLKSPGKARVHNNLGRVLLEKERVEEAEASFERARELDSESYLAQSNLGLIYMKEDRLVEAKAMFEKLIRQYPFFAEPYVHLADLYASINEDELALQNLRVAQNLKPAHSPIYIALGNIYLKKGDFLGAKAEFRKVLWLKPESAIAYYNLGNAFLKEGNYYEALFQYQRAIHIDSDFAEPHVNTGNIYFYFMDYKGAIEQYRKALEKNPALPEAYYNLANALHAIGSRREAREAVEKAMVLYGGLGEMEKAESIRQILAKEDENAP